MNHLEALLSAALLAAGCSDDGLASEGGTEDSAGPTDPSGDDGDGDPSGDGDGPPCGGDILGCDATPMG